MVRAIATALAVLAAFLMLSLAAAQAADRLATQRIVKHQKFKMISDRQHRHHRRDIRVVNRSVLVVKLNGIRDRTHALRRQGDTYSGDVVVNVQNGVGQWSYGTSAMDRAATAAPSAKIIDVDALKPGSACDMQAGVCVIRP